MLSIYQGCMLGMAVGDAMGNGIDAKSLEEIRADYGPEGLRGYDLANGLAEISSYTQVASFAMNGLLVGMAHGQLKGPFIPNVTMALKEWARAQYFPRETERKNCWLYHEIHMRRRKMMDSRTLDALTRTVLGTPEKPANNSAGPGTLPAAVVMGLLYAPERMEAQDVGRLGAEVLALTHGDATTFLCGALLAYIIAGTVQDRESGLEIQFINAADAVAAQFSAFPEAKQLQRRVKKAVATARMGEEDPVAYMESLKCMTAAEVLCGAVYACIASGEDFDNAIIIAINHSGKSAAVGAICGAILGAHLGVEALPDFYVDCLDAGDVIRELTADFHSCDPGRVTRCLFDDDWDRKYTYGLPVDRT